MNATGVLRRLICRKPAEGAIRGMVDGGAPAGLEPALRYLITEKLAIDDRTVLATIDGFRRQLLAQEHQSLTVFDSPLPVAPGETPVPGRPKSVTWRYLAEKHAPSNFSQLVRIDLSLRR